MAQKFPGESEKKRAISKVVVPVNWLTVWIQAAQGALIHTKANFNASHPRTTLLIFENYPTNEWLNYVLLDTAGSEKTFQNLYLMILSKYEHYLK
jgi:hypothetical protein